MQTPTHAQIGAGLFSLFLSVSVYETLVVVKPPQTTGIRAFVAVAVQKHFPLKKHTHFGFKTRKEGR